MENIKHCAVLVRRPQDIWEGTRTTLGLAVHNIWAYFFVLDIELEMNDKLQENLEWLEEMECACISNREENARYGFAIMTTDQLARELKKMDLVIPFGNRNHS